MSTQRETTDESRSENFVPSESEQTENPHARSTVEHDREREEWLSRQAGTLPCAECQERLSRRVLEDGVCRVCRALGGER